MHTLEAERYSHKAAACAHFDHALGRPLVRPQVRRHLEILGQRDRLVARDQRQRTTSVV